MQIRTSTSFFPRGFTLIELMVVISIIALLSSIVLASLSTTKAYAEDSARAESLHSVSTALELYNSANGHYPVHAGSTGISLQNMVQSDLAPYMAPLPSSFSVGSDGDYYVSDATGASYELLVARQTSNTGASNFGSALSGSSCNSSDYSSYSSNVGGSAFCVGVNVSAPLWTAPVQNPPTLTLQVSPTGTLSNGTQVTLTVTSSNAETCQITQDTTFLFVSDDFSVPIGTDVSTVHTVSNGGVNQSGVVGVTCYSGSYTGTSTTEYVGIAVAH